MNEKPIWIRILVDTIGIPSIIAFIVGVPALITLVISIWGVLSWNRQIIVGITSGLILIAITLFIYGQTRKILYKIPHLLLKRHSIIRKHAKSINIVKDISEPDFYNAYKLIGIDFAKLVPCNTLDEIRNKIDVLYARVNEKGTSSEEYEQFCDYLMKKTGLLLLLEQDRSYKKLSDQLTKMYQLIPNEDILTAIKEFIKISNSMNVCLPLTQVPDEVQIQVFPVKLEANYVRINEKLDNIILEALVKVREGINRYYDR